MPEDVLEGERRAVIVGIDDYEDEKIPPLQGAKNDAEDILQRLIDHGKFIKDKVTPLYNTGATCHEIRKAISDLLYQTDECDLALFYYSGHGFVDGRGNGYLATHDMRVKEPFVCGIDMLELKKMVLNSINKATVLMILDCCYGGITTKGERDAKVKQSIDPYFKLVEEKEGEGKIIMKGGEGKIIISSSEEDEISREIECTHENGQKKHHHGAYTSCLIRGLDGNASDDYGIIYLDKLRDYAEREVMSIGRQKPKFFAAETTGISNIKIAIAPKKYAETMDRKIKDAENLFKTENVSSIICAINLISGVLNINPKYKEALILKEEIGKTLAFYQECAGAWFISDGPDVSPKIPNVYNKTLTIFNYLDYEKITKLDRDKITLLDYLCKVSTRKMDNDTFINLCKPVDKPRSTQK